MADYPYFCTDCNEGRARLTEDGRCTMCHGARIITHASQRATQVGPVTVRFTFGSIGKLSPQERHHVSDSSGVRERKPPCPGCDGHECDEGCQYPVNNSGDRK